MARVDLAYFCYTFVTDRNGFRQDAAVGGFIMEKV